MVDRDGHLRGHGRRPLPAERQQRGQLARLRQVLLVPGLPRALHQFCRLPGGPGREGRVQCWDIQSISDIVTSTL